MKPILILDVDGVIFDSNRLKENNIREATLNFVNEEVTDDFISYFTSLNGVPREIKINDYFKDAEISEKILSCYNSLNASTLSEVDFTQEAYKTLQELSCEYSLIALSGGDEDELNNLFKVKGIDSLFDDVFGAPNTKLENLKKVDRKNVLCFVGDSKVDFEVAKEFDIPFMFMKTYTQFTGWQRYFKKHKEIPIISYIKDIPKTIKYIN